MPLHTKLGCEGNMSSVVEKIAATQDLALRKTTPLSGGDVNEVLLLETAFERYVMKLNDSTKFPDMFKAEAKGLRF